MANPNPLVNAQAYEVKSTHKVIHVIDSLAVGGAQDIIRSLLVYGKYPQEVIVLHASPHQVEQWRNLASIRALASHRRLSLLSLIKLAALIRKNPDAIFNVHLQVSNLFMISMRALMKFKLVLTLHAVPAQLHRWYLRIYRVLCAKSDAFIVEDRINKEFLESIRIHPSKIFYIPIGTPHADAPLESDNDVRTQFGIPQTSPIFLNIARMVAPKGQVDAIEALKIVNEKGHDAHLVIVGDGPLRATLEKIINLHGLRSRVHLAGFRTDLHNFYIKANAFLMPCHDESMGVVVYEALAYGLKVIAYDSGSIREAIDSEEKGSVIARESRALAQTMIQYLMNKSNSVHTLDKHTFSASRMAESYDQVYAQLIL